MILDHRFRTTIVAIDPGLGILEFDRHRLSLNCSFQMSELHFHVHDASTTYRASIRVLHVLIVTKMMDTVATTHEHNGLRRSEHVFTAYRAVTVCRTLNTAMGIANRNRQTHTASLYLKGELI